MRSLHPFLAVLVVALAGAGCTDDKADPTPACQAVLDCYFAGDALNAVPGFAGLFPDSEIVAETYGKGGTCWIGEPAIAQSCDDRCKGLLWQDCARSYRRVCVDAPDTVCLVDTDCEGGAEGACVAEAREGEAAEFEAPFCANACSEEFALRCRFEDFAILQGQGRQEDEPLFSACPEGTRCNAIPPDFAGPDRAPPDAASATGCCENTERDLLVEDRQTCAAPPVTAE